MNQKAATSRFLDWLNEELEKRDWNDSQASIKAGLSHGAIHDIRAGLPPGIKKIRALARLFGYPEEHVLRLAGHLPALPRDAGLSPRAQADLDQIRRYVEMMSPERQKRVTDILVEMARELSEASRDESAA